MHFIIAMLVLIGQEIASDMRRKAPAGVPKPGEDKWYSLANLKAKFVNVVLIVPNVFEDEEAKLDKRVPHFVWLTQGVDMPIVKHHEREYHSPLRRMIWAFIIRFYRLDCCDQRAYAATSWGSSWITS